VTPENTDSPNALKLFAQQTGLVKGAHAVEFRLGNLTAVELNLCACLKQLLCDPRFDGLRRKLNQGAGLELCITPAGGLQIVANEWQFNEGDPTRN
jgi:hypothetical protein